jgi:hypothetical protein
MKISLQSLDTLLIHLSAYDLNPLHSYANFHYRHNTILGHLGLKLWPPVKQAAVGLWSCTGFCSMQGG